MKPFEMEPTWLTFPGRAIVYPAVYVPSSKLGGPKFSIGADAARLSGSYSEDTETFVRLHMSGKGFISATSIARPEIECSDIARLIALLQSMDARNVNRDKLFGMCPIVSFGVSPYRYTMRYRNPYDCGPEQEIEPSFGYALYLHKVRISLPNEDVK